MSKPRVYNPFSTTAILTPSSTLYEHFPVSQAFEFHDDPSSDVFHIPRSEGLSLDKLQPTSLHLDLENISLPSIDAPSISGNTSEFEDAKPLLKAPTETVHEEDDIWKLPETFEYGSRTNLLTWDTFRNPDHTEPQTAFTAEAGPRTFSAILQRIDRENHKSFRLAKSEPFLQALSELVLGRSSAFFQWDGDTRSFTSTVDRLSIVGISADLMAKVIDVFVRTGSQTRALLEETDPVNHHAKDFTTTQIALSAAVRSSLLAIHQNFELSRPKICSVVQLRNFYHEPILLINMFHDLFQSVVATKQNALLLSTIISKLQAATNSYPAFENTMHFLLSRIVEPLFGWLSTQIGLTDLTLTLSRDDFLQEQEFPNECWKLILSEDVLSTVVEARNCLILLHAESAGSNTTLLSSAKVQGPSLHLQRTWEDLIKIHKQAADFERDLKAAMLECYHVRDLDQKSPGVTQPVERYNGEDQNPYTFNPNLFEGSPLAYESAGDSARSAVPNNLEKQSSEHGITLPCDQALSLSVMPYLQVQHRFLTFVIMQKLFQELKLQENIGLQYQFQLFGDGLFASRVSIALFDPEQASGEGKRRIGLTTGLRLQGRDAWPPASSELRLALMSILSESLLNERDADLADSVSFAIRDLSDEELEQCRDLSSIHALDFLKIQYRQPNALLESVITNDILIKYDRIFKHLLRLLRLKCVAQSLMRTVSNRNATAHDQQDRKLRIQMQQFISAIADYSQNTVITMIWQKFNDKLRNIRAQLVKRDYDGTLKEAKSVEYLKHLHNETLDQILHSLLLKRKQNDIRMALEAIFNIILRYSLVARDGMGQNSAKGSVHTDFRHAVRTFLKQLDEARMHNDSFLRRGVSGRSEEGEHINLFDQLYLRLNFSGYWSR